MSAVLLVAVVALLARAPAAAAASQGGVGTPAAAAAAAAAAAGNQPEVTLVGRFVPGPDDRPAQLPQASEGTLCKTVAAAWPSHRCVAAFMSPPFPLVRRRLQLFTWSGSSASVAFDGATAVAVVLNGSLAGLPNGTDVELIRATDARFPLAFFRVGWRVTLGGGTRPGRSGERGLASSVEACRLLHECGAGVHLPTPYLSGRCAAPPACHVVSHTRPPAPLSLSWTEWTWGSTALPSPDQH